MKLKYKILILYFSFFIKTEAQNLVPNWSFEDTLQCPFNPSQVSFAPPWYDPTNGSSDYFNACNNGGVGVPNNDGGHQFASTGNAYMGLYTYYSGMSLREYIQVKLIEQLKTNKKYCAEFYVSLADTVSIAANNIGMYFSDSAITGSFGSVLNVIPQINNNITLNPLTDKTGWTKASGIFIANGTENYITIGNFLNDPNTDTAHVTGGSYPGSYYYIDDVTVQCCDCDTTPPINFNYNVPNAFSPNNDGHNDLFILQGWENITKFIIVIYNRWGEKVFESNDPEIGWDGTYKGILMDPAVFAYYINATTISGEKIVRKGNISLVR